MKKKAQKVLSHGFRFVQERKWLLLTMGLLIIGGIFIAYRRSQANIPDYTFTQPERKTLTKTLEISGVVDAEEKARLRFLAGGKVVYIGAKEGDWVKKWQTIATIDQATLRKQLQQDLNAYERERLSWENTQDSVEDRWIPETERRTVEQEQQDLENEVLDVEIRNIAINNTVLSAPFAGILTVSPTPVAGVQLAATDYFEIVNPNTLLFRATVDETDINEISLGQRATLELDAYRDQTYDTTVSYISYTSRQDTSGTVFDVEFPLQTADINQFRLGMNGDISILLQEKANVLVIPLETTRFRDDGVYVDVRIDDITVEERKIETGLETDDEIEVISGLDESDLIVIPE